MFRCTPSTPSNSFLCLDDHITVFGEYLGSSSTWAAEMECWHRLPNPSGLLAPVGPRRCDKSRSSSASIRAHNRCARLPSVLCTSEHMEYRIAKLTYKVLIRSSLSHLGPIMLLLIGHVAHPFTLLSPTAWWCHLSNWQQSVAVVSRQPFLTFAMRSAGGSDSCVQSLSTSVTVFRTFLSCWFHSFCIN